MKVAITGANGFLGSHLVEMALSKGYEVTALLRKSADLSNLSHLDGYLKHEIDYSSAESLASALETLPQQDLIIHNAGLTKSYTLDRYITANVDVTEKFIKAIQLSDKLKTSGNFAYISSLAAIGPVGSDGPVSNYGRSKVMAEEKVKLSGINYMIFRPTGIYGSRDVQFVPLIKAAKLGIYPLMTSAEHKMTLINAKDVANNVIDCSINHTNKIVHLEDGKVYLHKDLKRILEKTLNKSTRQLKVGTTIVKGLLGLSDIIDKNLNRTPALSLEHYTEISQDWDYDFGKERKEIPLTIDYTLEKGFQEAVKYYQENHLI